MKRGIIFPVFYILIILTFLVFFAKADSNSSITGETITTETTSPFSMSITVIAVPALTIIFPSNGTYVTNTTLPLSYYASPDTNNTFYNFDSGANQTLSSSTTYFNISEGTHTLFLYANNSYGMTLKTVTFTVNITRFLINYTKYSGITKGNSTNFYSYSYEQMQNLSNITLENNNSGKIVFNSLINITQNTSGNFLDIDSNTNISSNRIELNSTALSHFNVSSSLFLYGLSFSNPRILKDGSVCPESICTYESYNSGILKFNVTGFSVYSSEETPSAPPVTPVSPGGGGGGGAPVIKVKSFSLSTDEIKAKVQQGRVVTEQVMITNNMNQQLDFEISISKVEKFVIPENSKFSLAPKESKIMTLEIIAEKDTSPDLYIGQIAVKANGEEQDILAAIEVESAQPLFDVSVTIPKEYEYVMPGEEMTGEIQIYNLGEVDREVDINVEYKIMDWRGNEVLKQEEELAVNTKISFIKNFKIPENAEYGKYVLYVKITYKDKVASGSAWFNIGKAPTIPIELATIAISVFIAVAVAVIIIRSRRKIKKQAKPVKRIDERALRRANILKR